MNWTICDEELPDIDKEVLIFADYCGIFSVGYIASDGAWRYSMFHDELDFEPTHWQPLPEPPKDD